MLCLGEPSRQQMQQTLFIVCMCSLTFLQTQAQTYDCGLVTFEASCCFEACLPVQLLYTFPEIWFPSQDLQLVLCQVIKLSIAILFDKRHLSQSSADLLASKDVISGP